LQFLPGALEYSHAGAVPGGLGRNRAFAGPSVRVERNVDAAVETLLYDPQTSGGLLIAMDKEDVKRMTSGFVVGRVVASSGKAIHLV
jgi:selenide,water dikinase